MGSRLEMNVHASPPISGDRRHCYTVCGCINVSPVNEAQQIHSNCVTNLLVAMARENNSMLGASKYLHSANPKLVGTGKMNRRAKDIR